MRLRTQVLTIMMISEMLRVFTSLKENSRSNKLTLCSIMSALDSNLLAAVSGVVYDEEFVLPSRSLVLTHSCTEKSVSKIRAVKTSSMLTTLNL